MEEGQIHIVNDSSEYSEEEDSNDVLNLNASTDSLHAAFARIHVLPNHLDRRAQSSTVNGQFPILLHSPASPNGFHNTFGQDGGILDSTFSTYSHEIPSQLEHASQLELALKPVSLYEQWLCRVVRRRDPTSETQKHPIYEMYIEQTDSNVSQGFLMCAKIRRTNNTGAVYDIYLDMLEHVPQKARRKVGQVKSNFLGTSFTIQEEETEREMATVVYEANVLGNRGPRKFKVVVPAMKNKTERYDLAEMEQMPMKHRYLTTLHNKMPQFDPDTGEYLMNFQDRVTEASVKNFQLIHDLDPDYVVMQFGKVADNTFSLDFQYPLCPLQAFGIAITSLDVKLACQ